MDRIKRRDLWEWQDEPLEEISKTLSNNTIADLLNNRASIADNKFKFYRPELRGEIKLAIDEAKRRYLKTDIGAW